MGKYRWSHPKISNIYSNLGFIETKKGFGGCEKMKKTSYLLRNHLPTYYWYPFKPTPFLFRNLDGSLALKFHETIFCYHLYKDLESSNWNNNFSSCHSSIFSKRSVVFSISIPPFATQRKNPSKTEKKLVISWFLPGFFKEGPGTPNNHL